MLIVARCNPGGGLGATAVTMRHCLLLQHGAFSASAAGVTRGRCGPAGGASNLGGLSRQQPSTPGLAE